MTKCTCMSLCVYMPLCMLKYVSAHAYMCLCVWRLYVGWCQHGLFSPSSHYFVYIESLTRPELTNLFRLLAGQWVPGFLSFLCDWITDVHWHTQLFTKVQGIQTQVLMFVQQTRSWLSHISHPNIYFWVYIINTVPYEQCICILGELENEWITIFGL